MSRGWWWLSFVDSALPKGSQFLGVCVVLGDNLMEAVEGSHRLRVNPGGEVVGMEIPTGMEPPVEKRNRLLGEKEARELAAWSSRPIDSWGREP